MSSSNGKTNIKRLQETTDSALSAGKALRAMAMRRAARCAKAIRVARPTAVRGTMETAMAEDGQKRPCRKRKTRRGETNMSDWIDDERDKRSRGITTPLLQSQHAAVNARYPGCTWEYCCECQAPTGRAGRSDDSLFIDDDGPFCLGCFENITGV